MARIFNCHGRATHDPRLAGLGLAGAVGVSKGALAMMYRVQLVLVATFWLIAGLFRGDLERQFSRIGKVWRDGWEFMD